jgi:hypothetical protein
VYRPLAPSAVVDALVATMGRRVVAGGPHLRVAVDGAPAADPARLADAVVAPLRAGGRPVVRVSAGTYLRPASVRLEHGRTDPDALYEDWLDEPALRRELLEPLGPTGNGRFLPSLWDAERDRATRAPYEVATPGTVLLLDGTLLLGRGLPFDLTVHVAVRPATLQRIVPAEDRWTLAAHGRYRTEVSPEDVADVVVRVDDPARPALLLR